MNYEDDDFEEEKDFLDEAYEFLGQGLTDEEFIQALIDLLEGYEDDDEDDPVIYDFDWYLENSDFKKPPEPEHPEAKLWREIAEKYEQENILHQRWHNMLLMQLWQTGGLTALGNRGALN